MQQESGVGMMVTGLSVLIKTSEIYTGRLLLVEPYLNIETEYFKEHLSSMSHSILTYIQLHTRQLLQADIQII